MTAKRRRGLFIVLEGLDGAGTTTQLERLGSALRKDGHPVLTTSEPSSGPVGVLIRQALQGRVTQPTGEALSHETLALLFAADRLDHLEAEILPALGRGTHVLCDRYVLSSLAYQGAHVPAEWVEELNARALAPDLTLFLEVDPQVASRRRTARGGTPEIYELDARQRRIAAQYQALLLSRRAKDRIVVVDGEQPLEEVTREVLARVRAELPRPTRARAHGAGR